jgi:dihydroorotate dehydrogenase
MNERGLETIVGQGSSFHGALAGAIWAAVKIPVWVKITGQSEGVPDLAQSAFSAGADAVVSLKRIHQRKRLHPFGNFLQ